MAGDADGILVSGRPTTRVVRESGNHQVTRKVGRKLVDTEASVKTTFTVHDGDLCIDGKPIFGGNEPELLDEIDRLVATDQAGLLVTLNVDQTLNLETDPEFRHAVHNAEMVVIDGTPISWLGRMLGAKEAARNAGADLLPAVAREAESRGWKIAITGGADETVRIAAENLRRVGADVVAIPFPMISSSRDERASRVVEALAGCRPSLVFLCLGSPKQELWFEAWRDRLPAAVYVGAGAAVDFAASSIDRAPKWMQRAGLEWLFRLLREPRRLAGRYLIKGPRFVQVFFRAMRHRQQQGQHG